MFWNDFNDHLILYASFLDRRHPCRNRTHDGDLRRIRYGIEYPNVRRACRFSYKSALSTLHTGTHELSLQKGRTTSLRPEPSFATLATRNLSVVLAGILIFCCVLGLKPARAFLFYFPSLPKPGRTNSPVFFVVL